MRVVDAADYREPRDAISHDWIRFLVDGGFEPVLIPNLLSDPVAFVRGADVRAIVLSNGEDVDPSTSETATRTDGLGGPARDHTERQLFAWALENNRPVLAVCRGFQLVNVLRGGRLVAVNGGVGAVSHVASEHDIEICDEATRARFDSDRGRVNSFHRSAVRADTLGRDLVPFAKTADGIIEGYYLRGKQVLGLQWHPERPGAASVFQRRAALDFLANHGWWHQRSPSA